MIDVKGLLIISATLVLVAVTIGFAIAGSGPVTIEKALVEKRGAHPVIILEVNGIGVHGVREIRVNGVRVKPPTSITIPPGTRVLVIESTSSVRVFPSLDAALAYLHSPASLTFPGNPLPSASSYTVEIVFNDGSRLRVNVKA